MDSQLFKTELLIYFDLDNKYSLAPAALQTFYPSVNPTTNDSGWAEKTSLDVEWAHELASDATIDLAVAKATSL